MGRVPCPARKRSSDKRDHLRSILQPANLKAFYRNRGPMSSPTSRLIIGYFPFFYSDKFFYCRFDAVAALFDFFQRSCVSDADVLRRPEVLARNGKHTGLREKIFHHIARGVELLPASLLP